jgi:uncharacterized protein YbjT (DUF2867 family)
MADPMIIWGATSPIGIALAEMAKAAGHEVTAIGRDPEKMKTLQQIGVATVTADALDPASVKAAYDSALGAKIAVSTVGGLRGNARRPDAEGNINIIDGAKAACVARFVFVTTIGAGDSLAALEGVFRDRLAPVSALKAQAEEHLRKSGMGFTIIRPGGLLNAPASGSGVLSEDPKTHGAIARAEVASLVMQCLADPGTLGKTYSAVDPLARFA